MSFDHPQEKRTACVLGKQNRQKIPKKTDLLGPATWWVALRPPIQPLAGIAASPGAGLDSTENVVLLAE
jgi:hypothetical protein